MKKILMLFWGLVVASPLVADSSLDLQKDILQKALKWQGVPYVWAGKTPKGFDCSGFIYFLYKDFIPGVPASARVLGTFGTSVNREELRPGDLVFFATGGSPSEITHVALYLGQNSVIHAVSDGPKTGILISDLDEKYWKARIHSFGRLRFPTGSTVVWGQPGTVYDMQYARGKYRGEMADGLPQGQGTFHLANGDLFEGHFNGGLFNGQGVYTWADKSRYKGTFREGHFDGVGTLDYSNGNQYSGTWKDDRMEGSGVYVWASGARYEGLFRNFEEAGGWYEDPRGRKAWALSERGSLKFYTDESQDRPAMVSGPSVASAKSLSPTGGPNPYKGINGFQEVSSLFDNFQGDAR